MVTLDSQLSKPIAYPSIPEDRSWQAHHPSIGLTPQKLGNILRSAENGNSDDYFSLCTDMEEKWPRYATVLGVRKRQIAGLSFSVQPNKSAAENDTLDERNRHADLISRFLDNGILQDNLFAILDAVGKGISVTEIIWKNEEKKEGNGGVWLPEKLYPRPQQWFEYIKPGDVHRSLQLAAPRLMMKKGGNDFLPLPPYRFIVHSVALTSGVIPCSGLGRIASWWYLFYNHTIKDWLGFMEVYGKPLRLGKYPPTASDEEKHRLRNALISLGSDGTAVIPDNVVIDFLQNAQGKTSSDIYLSAARYIDERITEVVLGQTLTTEVRQGSFAAAKVHDNVRQDIASSDADLLIKTIERDVVKPIIDLNFGPQHYYPKLFLHRNNALSRSEKIESLLKFIPLGLEIGQDQIRSLIGIENPSQDDTILKLKKQSE